MILVLHFIGGMALGALYFCGLWWNTRMFGEAGRLLQAIALLIARVSLLAGLLAMSALEGALPLLVVVLGVLAARAVVMRRIRRVAA